MGWHRHAIIFSFYYLLRYAEYTDKTNFYSDCIRQIIKEGGDTDTNAAIVGGMLGALIGFKNIPEYMTQKVLNFDCEKIEGRGKPRPEFLSTKKYALKNIKELMSLIPK